MLRVLLLLLFLLTACDRGPWIGQLTTKDDRLLEVHAPHRLNGFQRECLTNTLDPTAPAGKTILSIKEDTLGTPPTLFTFTFSLYDSTDRSIRKSAGGNPDRDRAFEVAVCTLFFCPE